MEVIGNLNSIKIWCCNYSIASIGSCKGIDFGNVSVTFAIRIIMQSAMCKAEYNGLVTYVSRLVVRVLDLEVYAS